MGSLRSLSKKDKARKKAFKILLTINKIKDVLYAHFPGEEFALSVLRKDERDDPQESETSIHISHAGNPGLDLSRLGTILNDALKSQNSLLRVGIVENPVGQEYEVIVGQSLTPRSVYLSRVKILEE